MKLYKIIFLMFSYLFVVNNIFAQVYEKTPDVNNCEKGALTLTEKNKVLNLINEIRRHHDLGELKWSNSKEKYPQSAALSMLATGIGGHGATSGKCCNADSDTGRAHSNLGLRTSTSNELYPSEAQIYRWLIDNNNASEPSGVGHRRSVINPFLSSTCFGRAEGKHPTNTGYYLITAALWAGTSDEYQASSCKNDFIAYPFKNYHIDWVDPSFYLSFSPIADPSWYGGGYNTVRFDKAVITMRAAGKSVQIVDVHYDYQIKGGVANNLSWKVVGGLKNEVRYYVTISNVIVNGAEREYSYWFKLTNNDNDDEPFPPMLVYPTAGLKNVDVSNPVVFRWKRTAKINKYKLQLSLSKDFDNIYKSFETKDTSVSVKNLEKGCTFYWRVVGFYNDSKDSVYSEEWKFSTMMFAPTLVYPTAGLENLDVSLPVEFRWNKAENIYRYELQLSLNSDFNDIYDNYRTKDTSAYVANLKEGHTFYWRVAGFYNDVEEPVYSDVWNFSTKEKVIAPPTIIYPASNAVNIYLRDVYKWNSIPNALYYRLQIATSEKFTKGSIAVDANKISDTIYYLASNEVLEANTNYFWRICATLSNSSVTNWCDPIKFATGEEYSTVNEPVQLISYIIYPNPSNNLFTVLLNLLAPVNNLTISIVDMNGNIIMSNNCGYVANGSTTYSFNTNILSSGTYNIILNIDGKTKVEKLIIER